MLYTDLLLETYAADSRLSAAEFRAYKYDLAYSRRSDMAAVLREFAALPDEPGLVEAKALLARWDGRTGRDSRAAALAVLAAVPVINGRTGDGPKISPRQALLDAVETLKTRFGRIDPTWGEVNRLRRGPADLPVDGGPDILRAVYGTPDDDGRLKGVAGDTFIMFVSWDREGRLASESVHQFGSNTTRRASPHYADQVALFAAMKTKPVLFTEAQLAASGIAEDYRPGERTRR